MLAKLFDEQRVAMVGGTISFVCFMVMSLVAVIDRTELLGVGRWIKPVKFYISIAIFMWTIGIYLYFLNGWKRFSRRISWGLVAVFVVEMVIITGQAARGVKSHFNFATAFDAILFAVMGFAIAVSTILTAMILYAYLRGPVDLSPSMRHAMQLGLAVSLIGTILGGYMSAQTGHTVGAPDGGPGLMFVNWSTVAGDLRIAHFLGLHGLQAVPLFAVAFSWVFGSRRAAATFVFSILYTAIVAAAFVQALLGRPLL